MEMKYFHEAHFHGTYSNLTYFFISCKILKYFSALYNLHLLILLQKWVQTSKVKKKIKQHMCKSDSIFPYLVHYLNDFWNLSLDKVYLKNEW